MFVIAVNKKDVFIFELWFLPSILDDLSFKGLVGKLHDDIGVHSCKATSYMLNVGFNQLNLEDSEYCISFTRFINVSVWTATTHFMQAIKYNKQSKYHCNYQNFRT